ncbi:MAG: cupin domain-containing protein [Spongiibacteraceae bacterium]|jgi:1,2-dihydroxy-3-keto-5-methylthiopentene dioxygenase|nr:cupin domain-containing protein [Spongiibacteraceae bacterium]
MSQLTIFADHGGMTPTLRTDDPAVIASQLGAVGVRFEQWQASQPIAAGASQEAVLAAYRSDVDRLVAEAGYQTVDVISLNASHPDKAALREKFLSEHTHSEDEVRFFVAGRGLFSLHIGSSVYEVLCEKGDLISVPANTPHWFDMGSEPDLVAIRFFDNPEGWVARFTGSAIAEQFSRLP